MPWLRQSTAATVKLGPFVDETDGKTAETGLTISQADIRISKAGGAFAQSNNSAGATHDENGYYGVPLDTTDTNTLGRLKVCVSESGTLPVWQEFVVLPAVVYDSLVAGSDNLQVDAVQLAGVTQSLTDLKDFADTGYDPATHKVQGVVLTDTVTTLTGHTPQTGDAYARLGAPAGASVSADVAGVKQDTAAILDDTGSSGVVVASASKTGYTLSTAGILAIWDAATSALTTVGSIGKLLVDRIDATINSRLASASYTAPDNAGISVAATQATAAATSAASADSKGTTILARLGAWTGTGINNILGALRAIAAKAAALTPTDLSTGTGFDNTYDSLEAIRDRGDAAWLSTSAAGSNAVTFTVRDSVSLTPLNDQAVVIYAADGTTLVDAKRTNASGEAVFSLDSANYYYALPPSAGYSSVSNTALTVDGAETVTVGKVAISSASTAPGTRVVRCIVRGADGELKSGVVVSATLQSDPSTVDQAILSRQKLTDTTDANGIADLTCITSDQFTHGTGVYVFNAQGIVRVESAVAAGSGVVYLEDLVA